MRGLALTAALLGVSLAGCVKHLEAPTDVRVCYAMNLDKQGKAHFNTVAENVPNMENCAAQLEGMRLRFVHLGAPMAEVTGSYQSEFIFIRPEGVFTAKYYEGVQYPALVRTGDGRLVVPGRMPVD